MYLYGGSRRKLSVDLEDRWNIGFRIQLRFYLERPLR